MAPRAYTQRCASREEFVAAARAAGGETVLLLSACDEARRPLLSVIGDVRRVRPRVPVVLLACLDAADVHALVALSNAGNVEVIIAGCDDAFAVIARCVARQRAATVWERIRARLEPYVDAQALRIIRQCIMMGRRRSSVAELARRMGVSRRTIASHLSAAGLPPASDLLAWGRVLAATSELETAASIEAVALQLGFGSAAGFQNVCRRHLGVPASHVRGAGRDDIADRFAEHVLQRCPPDGGAFRSARPLGHEPPPPNT